MFTRAPRSVAALLAALVLLSMTVGMASAATGPVPQDFSFDERGITAHASWLSCTEPDEDGLVRCVSTSAQLFDGRQRNRDPEFGYANSAFSYLCLIRYEDIIDEEGFPVGPPREEGGCVDAPEIVVADGLEQLDLSTSLELVEQQCVVDPETWETICEPVGSRMVAVDLEFTGVGDVIADRWRSSGTAIVDGVRCHMSSSSRGEGRDAEAVLSLDGESIGLSEFAFITDGRTRMAQHCSG